MSKMTKRDPARTCDGKPIHAMPTPEDIMRFLRLVKIEIVEGKEHWLWQGHCDDKGYGQFKFAGRAYWAHRWAFQVFRGMLAHQEQANHLEECRMPKCVCPWHMNGADLIWNSTDGAKARWAKERASEEPAPF